MNLSGFPIKYQLTWGEYAGAGYIRTPPFPSQIGVQNGAASFNDGFPPNCFVAIASGGSWPFGQDFNGILNLLTSWQQVQQAGGMIGYDGTFSGEIGGYPKGCRLLHGTYADGEWKNLVDANTTDPDTGGANWSAALLGIGLDANGFSLRLIDGNYGAGIVNNGTICYLASTASGSQDGAANSYRPLSWSLSTGVVTIAGNGTAVVIDGQTTINANIQQSNSSTYTHQVPTILLGNAISPGAATYNTIYDGGEQDIALITNSPGNGGLRYFDFNSNGNCYAYSGSFVNGSAEEKKSDITRISPSGIIDKLIRIGGYSFNWKDDGRADMGVTYEKVLPEFPELCHSIMRRPRKADNSAIDLEAASIEEKGVHYSGFVGPFIAALEEMQNKIAALASEFEAYKAAHP